VRGGGDEWRGFQKRLSQDQRSYMIRFAPSVLSIAQVTLVCRSCRERRRRDGE
jgi:hypothetical protein